MKYFNVVTTFCAMIFPGTIFAASAESDVTARLDVPVFLQIAGPDGGELPRFDLSGSKGSLASVTQSVQIQSNDYASGVQVSLVGDAQISLVSDEKFVVPLRVKISGLELTAALTTIGSDIIRDGSTAKNLPLEIGPKEDMDLPAGSYTGGVRLLVTHVSKAF